MLLRKPQDFSDGLSQAVPLRFLFSQPFPTGSRKAIDPCPSTVVGELPFGRDPAGLFHAMKRRIERPLFDAQSVIRDLLNARRETVPMLWLATQHLQEKKIQRPLKRIRLLCLVLYTQNARVVAC